ncbi:MAG: hypothetical protein H7Y27_12560, partial [Gemmatimonadaceae bacterium]|nr:hypothetical protein [Chitinophagaceae bacterium]
MSIYLQLFIILPIAGFFLSLMIPRKKENVIATLAIATISLQLLGLLVFVAAWLFNGADVLDVRHATLYKTTNFEIFINFFFDKTTAVFAVVGALLCASVAVFSRFYLHREEGFKRFFNNILLFFTGYNIVIFSGNFETLFIGWEFLGISSFLLISFYRDRYLPVKNAMKVISLYRMSDVCLLLAMWLSHHFWHENISFVKMADPVFLTDKLTLHPGMGALIAVAFLIAAAAKSAQFPFSSWLPRAMEGPTSSSAIFYGSLSVHIGVFLLLRTFPFWENMTGIRIAIGIVGITTSIIAAYITRVQSTVKTQIAYASVVQIGLIFVEIALGLHLLALVHFSANAFLRTWQLLVSPSVLSYLVHNQFYHFDPSAPKKVNTGFRKISNSLYILSVKEWNLDAMLFRYLWSPFKEI